MAEEHSGANRKKNILLSRGSTSVNDSGHEAPLVIKKCILRLPFTFELRGELSNSTYPSHFNECKTSNILLSSQISLCQLSCSKPSCRVLIAHSKLVARWEQNLKSLPTDFRFRPVQLL